MRIKLVRVLVLGVFVLLGTLPARAERRLALVVGIDAYQNIDRLQKAVSDARALGNTLRDIGFDVTVGENLDRRGMSRSLVELENKISPGDTVFFFFAGHGFEITGRNYLLMADLPRPSPGQENLIKDEAFAADQIIDRIQAHGARATIAILDACRDNPFAQAGGRGLTGSRGLAQMTPSNGVFVVFSAGAKQSALDRLGDSDLNPNSVFTRVFLNELRTPGLTLDQMVRHTRTAVNELANSVGGQQTPAYYDQMLEDVVLHPAVPAVASPAPPRAVPAAAPSASLGLPAQMPILPSPPSIPDASAAIAECDRMGTSPYDLDRPPNVAIVNNLDPADAKMAIRTCEVAVAAQPNDRRLIYQLARAYYFSGNNAQARIHMERAAAAGSAAAWLAIGYMQSQGKGYSKNSVLAIQSFGRSAALGSRDASFSLGLIYETGDGVPPDLVKARQYYEEAAVPSDAEANVRLARLLDLGQGGAQDLPRARKLYEDAATLGNREAMKRLVELYRAGVGGPKNPKQADFWQKKVDSEN